MKRTITLLVDSSEKLPWKFPDYMPWYREPDADPIMLRVHQRTTRLAAGDYALEGYESDCIVERKGASWELFKNLMTPDLRRNDAALRRLVAACRHPVLIFDGGVGDLTTTRRAPPTERGHKTFDPRAVIDRLMATCIHYQIALWLLGGARTPRMRIKGGDLVLRLLLWHGPGRGFAADSTPAEAPGLYVPTDSRLTGRRGARTIVRNRRQPTW